MGWAVILLAAAFAAASNYCMRRTLDAGGSPRGFLLMQFGVSLLLNLALCSCPLSDMAQSWPMLAIGLGAGLLVFGMMFATGIALARGPAGLTFAGLNAATVVPGPAMALLFGLPFGFAFGWAQAAGLALVLLGLFWSARHERATRLWWVPATAAFSLHALLLCYMQWKCLLSQPSAWGHALVPFQLPAQMDTWFLPGMFIGAFLAQALTFVITERRLPVMGEWIFGLVGGAANGAGAYCLVWAVSLVTGQAANMLFPLFAVGIIGLTNLWSQVLYKEQVCWTATALASGGILLGTAGGLL
jgi:hypothetical protein